MSNIPINNENNPINLTDEDFLSPEVKRAAELADNKFENDLTEEELRLLHDHGYTESQDGKLYKTGEVPLTTGEKIVVWSVLGLVGGIIIGILTIGLLPLMLLSLPVLLFLTVVVGIYGLIFGEPEDRMKYLFPLVIAGYMLSMIGKSSMASIFDED